MSKTLNGHFSKNFRLKCQWQCKYFCCIVILPPMVVDRIIHPLFSSTREQWVIDERKCFNQIMLYLKNAFQKELWEVLGKFIFMKYTLFIQPKIGSHGSPDYIWKGKSKQENTIYVGDNNYRDKDANKGNDDDDKCCRCER